MLKTTRNVASIILSIALILGMMPISAFAADGNPPLATSGEIMAFAPLDESVANQSFENIEQMNLNWIEPPETLTVTVRLSVDETATPATTGGGTVEADIPVQWDMVSREETGNGGYITRFAPVIGEGFTLADGVELPTVTITVAQMDAPVIDSLAAATVEIIPIDGYVTSSNGKITISGLPSDGTYLYFIGASASASAWPGWQNTPQTQSANMGVWSIWTDSVDITTLKNGTALVDGTTYYLYIAKTELIGGFYYMRSVGETSVAFSNKNYTLYYNTTDSKMYKSYVYNTATGVYDFSNEYTEQTDKWTGSTTTLTLNGFEFETTSARGALNIPSSVTLIIEGTNTITATDGGAAVSCNGALTIQGNGTLNAAGTGSGGNGVVSNQGALTISDGTINATASAGSPAIAAMNSGGHVYITGGTVNASGGRSGIYASFGNSINISGGTITVTGSESAFYVVPTVSNTYWYKAGASDPGAWSTGPWAANDTDKYVAITYTNPGSSTPPAPPTPAPTTPSGGSSGGSSRSKGSSKQNIYTPASNPWLEPNPAQTLAGDAGKGQKDSIRTKSTNTYGVRKASWQKLKGYRYYHDTMDDSAVGVRLYIDNPTAMKRNMYVTGFVKGSFVDNRKAKFEKWFSNKIRVIHMDETEPWGQEVRIAAKVDLTGMDTENLYFYSYDKKTNKYTRIKEPKYWIDKNGYLHFYTELAGDIVISDGALEKK